MKNKTQNIVICILIFVSIILGIYIFLITVRMSDRSVNWEICVPDGDTAVDIAQILVDLRRGIACGQQIILRVIKLRFHLFSGGYGNGILRRILRRKRAAVIILPIITVEKIACAGGQIKL